MSSAYDALRRGTAFVLAGGSPGDSVKVVGNILAELDRLLHVLVVEAAHDRVIRLPARSSSTAARLGALHGARYGAAADIDRLQALSWSVSCLRRHDGHAHRADRPKGRWMTVGWPDGVASSVVSHKLPLRAPITPSAEQLGDVCAFYNRLASEIMAPPVKSRRPHSRHGLELSPA